jgi:hypothetical protein
MDDSYQYDKIAYNHELFSEICKHLEAGKSLESFVPGDYDKNPHFGEQARWRWPEYRVDWNINKIFELIKISVRAAIKKGEPYG